MFAPRKRGESLPEGEVFLNNFHALDGKFDEFYRIFGECIVI